METDEMIRDLVEIWDGLAWRHHGNGLLQAYVSLAAAPRGADLRVHVWCRELVTVEHGALHNHRYHLASTVLAGKLLHSRLEVTPDAAGDMRRLSVPGASRGEALRPVDRVRVSTPGYTSYQKGDRYTVDKWDYHHARQNKDDTDVTVTIVRLTDKSEDQWATVLAPASVAPASVDHAFGKPAEPGRMIAIARRGLWAIR